MASPKKLTLPVLIPPSVLDELHGIWLWNAERYSPAHADAYLAFLKKHIYGLESRYGRGKAVTIRPDLRYITIRRSGRGHGHVTVYRFDDKQVDVLHVFHTAQDWQNKLAGDSSSR
jgi:plasmid stabilization system protein ParE